VSETTEAIVFNAVPLLLLAAAYFGVAATLIPAVWREREEIETLDVAIVAVFPVVGFAAGALGVLILDDERAPGGHIWLVFAATILALLPVVVFVRRWSDRALVAGGIHRARVAEERISLRDREIEALAAIAAALARAPTLASAARPLVDEVHSLLDVGFAAVVLVDEEARQANGVIGLLDGEVAPWWADLELDLRNEPSGIASAVFEAAPVVVYDLESSPRVSPRLVARLGAKSGVFIPIIASDHVVGVLLAATTTTKHVFAAEEIRLLETLAAETAMALDRMRTAAALEQALDRERLSAEIGRRIRAEHAVDDVIRAAVRELESALHPEAVSVALGPAERDGIPVCAGATRHATILLRRAEPLADGERFLVDTVARELGLALETARLLGENQRRLLQQSALLHAAKVVTSELELGAVLECLVAEAASLLEVRAGDCYLYDDGLLRCAAVHGLAPSLVGFELSTDTGVAGLAFRRQRPASSDMFELAQPVVHDAYASFTRVLVAPILAAGAVRGVLGVAGDDSGRKFAQGDCELLEAFAGLAAVALVRDQANRARRRRGFVRAVDAGVGAP
jgi:GAF domain-containing protein